MQQALTLRLQCEGAREQGYRRVGRETRMKNAITRQVTNEILNRGLEHPGPERTLNDVALIALSISVGRGG